MFKAIKNTFTWGRASRTEYWLFALLTIIINMVIEVMGADKLVGSIPILIVFLVFYIFLFITSFTVSVRRFHDTGRSAWWFLMILLPVIGWIWLVVLTVLPSSQEDNKYATVPQ